MLHVLLVHHLPILLSLNAQLDELGKHLQKVREEARLVLRRNLPVAGSLGPRFVLGQ